MFWVMTASRSPRSSRLGERLVRRVRLLVAQVLEARPVVLPEPGRVAMEGVDVRHLHRVDLGPEPLPGRPEIRDSRRDRDPGPGQGNRRGRLANERRERLGAGRGLRAYLPCHFGVRLPRKALIPSLPSSERKAVGEALLLGLDSVVEVALVGDLLDLLDRDGSLTGQAAGPHQRRVEQLVVWDHAVGEPVLERVDARDGVADQVHLQRLRRADELGQALRPAEAGDDPELDLRLTEDRRGSPRCGSRRPWPARSRLRRRAS